MIVILIVKDFKNNMVKACYIFNSKFHYTEELYYILNKIYNISL